MLPSVNLSKATKVKEVEFRLHDQNVGRVTAMLQTARSENLQQIIIHFHCSFLFDPIYEVARPEWLKLDRLLIQLWTTHSICLVFTHEDDGKNSSWSTGIKVDAGTREQGF